MLLLFARKCGAKKWHKIACLGLRKQGGRDVSGQCGVLLPQHSPKIVIKKGSRF